MTVNKKLLDQVLNSDPESFFDVSEIVLKNTDGKEVMVIALDETIKPGQSIHFVYNLESRK